MGVVNIVRMFSRMSARMATFWVMWVGSSQRTKSFCKPRRCAAIVSRTINSPAGEYRLRVIPFEVGISKLVQKKSPEIIPRFFRRDRAAHHSGFAEASWYKQSSRQRLFVFFIFGSRA